MTIVQEIAQYLTAKGIVQYDENGTAGDCFLHYLPETPDRAVAIYRYGGPSDDGPLAYDITAVQIAVRGGVDESALTVEQRAQSIYNVLQGFHTNQFVKPTGSWIVSCYSPNNGGLIPMGPDTNGRFEFRMNFYVEHQNAQSVNREVL